MKNLWVILFVIPLFAQRVPDKKYFQDFYKLETQFKYTELKDYLHSNSELYEELLLVEGMKNLFGGAGGILDSIDVYFNILEVKTIFKDSEFLITKFIVDTNTKLGFPDKGKVSSKIKLRQFWIFKEEEKEWKLWSRIYLDDWESLKGVADIRINDVSLDSVNADSLFKNK